MGLWSTIFFLILPTDLFGARFPPACLWGVPESPAMPGGCAEGGRGKARLAFGKRPMPVQSCSIYGCQIRAKSRQRSYSPDLMLKLPASSLSPGASVSSSVKLGR